MSSTSSIHADELQMIVSRAIGPALCLSMCLWVAASDPALADETGGLPESWTGEWRLDRDRSDSPEPMMKALEVPWAMRKIALVFSPSLAIGTAGDAVELTVQGPFGDRVDRFYGDGVERAGRDQMDRSYRESSRWRPQARLVVVRHLTLKSGRIALIETTWRMADRVLTATSVVRIADEPEVQVRRFFTAREPEG
jgi:hypothetical protein